MLCVFLCSLLCLFLWLLAGSSTAAAGLGVDGDIVVDASHRMLPAC